MAAQQLNLAPANWSIDDDSYSMLAPSTTAYQNSAGFQRQDHVIRHMRGFNNRYISSPNSSHQPLEASPVTFEEPAGPAIPSTKESSSFGPITKKRQNSLDSSPIYEKKRKAVEEDGKGANPKAVGYDIQVLQMFSDHKEALIRNQEKAIRRGLVHTVKKATRMHIVGFLTGYPRMVCVQVVYPSITSEELKTSSCIPICLVQMTDKIVAALILTSPMNCAQLAMTTKLVDFGDLDEAYQPFITWLNEITSLSTFQPLETSHIEAVA